MAEALVSKRYDVSSEEVWGRVGDPAKLADWHPYITRTEMSDDGTTRVNTTADGARVAETILEQGDRYHVFRIDDGPVPYDGFVATIRARDDGEGACIVEWDARFEPKDMPEPDAVEFTRGFFQAGLDALA
jgi:hypothetical protein